jgi:copper chaperone CopZ
MIMNLRIRVLTVSTLLVVSYGCAEVAAPPAAVTAEATTATTFDAEKTPTVQFSVPDMMCPEGCGEKTKEILVKQPGAKEVVIDFEAKTATVAVEPDQFDAERALAAMVDYGFDNTTLKAAAAPAQQ